MGKHYSVQYKEYTHSNCDAMANNKPVPNEFFRPITQDIMIDPVIATKSGITYDKTALLLALNKKPECPITRKPMDQNDIFPNLALKNMIQDWQNAQNDDNESEQVSKVVEKTKKMKITPDSQKVEVSLSYDKKCHKTLMKLTPPKTSNHPSKRKPMKIAICIDVSGSMDQEAPIKNIDGSKESTGMNVLDIVRACGVAIVESLSKYDKVSIIKYTTNATCVQDLIHMDENGKKKAKDVLMSLEPECSTNIWDGLKVSWESLLKENFDDNCLESVFLLTDRMPNMHPSRGYKGALDFFKDKHFSERIMPAVTTFGFGKSLDTPLLVNLANWA